MLLPRSLSRLLSSVDQATISDAVSIGVSGGVVDWEHTEINHHTLDDLRRVRQATDGFVICRLNPPNRDSRAEVEQPIGAGADDVLVPMVRRVDEVERVLDLVNGRCGVGILIETSDAVRLARTRSPEETARDQQALAASVEARTPSMATGAAPA